MSHGDDSLMMPILMYGDSWINGCIHVQNIYVLCLDYKTYMFWKDTYRKLDMF